MWCCGASRSFRSSSVTAPEETAPEGLVRVSVGKADDSVLCRFEVEANYLNHRLFECLLRLTEEEIGHSYDGPLRIACDVGLFRYLVHLLDTRDPSAHYLELPDLMGMFSCSKAAGGQETPPEAAGSSGTTTT
ncbi:hypothetical protein SAY86_028259 [Trapa natans]|uniref:Uncharacterized protein n=1 Tax=Trapa natans TaxID=22666 RepID=A0AAN7RG85_TRANT|nr:hypothetical protein SAY86_028259 [Trapa natans]